MTSPRIGLRTTWAGARAARPALRAAGTNDALYHDDFGAANACARRTDDAAAVREGCRPPPRQTPRAQGTGDHRRRALPSADASRGPYAFHSAAVDPSGRNGDVLGDGARHQRAASGTLAPSA